MFKRTLILGVVAASLALTMSACSNTAKVAVNAAINTAVKEYCALDPSLRTVARYRMFSKTEPNKITIQCEGEF